MYTLIPTYHYIKKKINCIDENIVNMFNKKEDIVN